MKQDILQRPFSAAVKLLPDRESSGGPQLERRRKVASLSASAGSEDMEPATMRGRTGFDGGIEAGIASGCA